MTLTTYVLYVAAVVLLMVTPGPTMLMCMTNALNPAAPIAPQFALLALTFVAFEFTVLTLCALGVARLVPTLRSSGPVRWVNRVCGSLFALMSALLLCTRRSA